MKLITFILIVASLLQAKYISSKDCAQCHSDIYEEHIKSMHHNSTIFRDEVHKKIALATSKQSYECATCHMPSSPNLAEVMSDITKIDEKNPANQDGISCFYCHSIESIHEGKSNNINILADQKVPTFFGNLKNPEQSELHKSAKNKIFENSQVCMGCHSHKENDYGIEVCNAKDEFDGTSDCIGCHMKKTTGAVEKNNKYRLTHANHTLLGVRSAVMVKEATTLALKQVDVGIELSIKNNMGHSIITQPMRLKFVKTTVTRGENIIWSNFSETPLEDKNATFVMILEDEQKNPTIPANARAYKVNLNLKANQSKNVTYNIANLQKGDIVKSTWVSFTINPNIAAKLELSDKELLKPLFGDSKSITIE